MKFTGKIEFISPIQLVGEKQHEKQYFIISDEAGDYPNRLLIEGFNKKEEINKLKVGQIVEVDYNAKVNEYKGKHYCSLSLYKVKVDEKNSATPDPFQNGNSGDDELPF